jgi:GST-like protein
MIELYYWTTPNGHKVTMFLEEAGVEYRLIPINIGKGEQFKPEFLRISPNNRIPAMVDTKPADGGAPVSVFESGAILLYLGEKTGKFLPKTLRGRAATLEWLFWQMGGLGPMAGQNHHFSNYAPEKLPYAIDRYTNETRRLYGVMDKRLAKSRYLGGKDYGIADMAVFPWLRSWKNQGIAWADFPHLKGWFDEIAARPAVIRGVDVLTGQRRPLDDDPKAREVLFGQTQYARR